MSDLVIHLEEIKKNYIMGRQELQVLKGISLDIQRNEYVALMGPSGSGKSTLMNILGCLDSPSSGKYILNGHDVSTMLDNSLADIRNKEIGFVFQKHSSSKRFQPPTKPRSQKLWRTQGLSAQGEPVEGERDFAVVFRRISVAIRDARRNVRCMFLKWVASGRRVLAGVAVSSSS